MEPKKVLNNGHNLEQSKKVITFLTTKGWKTPKYIWVGKSEEGIEIAQMTKKECIAAIKRDNRLFSQKE